MISLQNKQEEQLILMMRELPEEMRKTLFKTAEQLREEIEEEEDVRDIIARLNEPDIPIDDAYRQIGLRE